MTAAPWQPSLLSLCPIRSELAAGAKPRSLSPRPLSLSVTAVRDGDSLQIPAAGRPVGAAPRAPARPRGPPGTVLLRGAGGERLRDSGGDRGHRTIGAVLVVTSGQRGFHFRARVGSEGSRCGRLPRGKFQRAVPHSRDAPLHARLSRETPGHVARGALSRGRAVARETPGSRRQVSREEEVPAAQDDLGRGAKDALLQGAHPGPAPGVVPAGPLPQPGQEARAGAGHGTHSDTSGQLVQEPEAEGPSSRCQKQVRLVWFDRIILFMEIN